MHLRRAPWFPPCGGRWWTRRVAGGGRASAQDATDASAPAATRIPSTAWPAGDDRPDGDGAMTPPRSPCPTQRPSPASTARRQRFDNRRQPFDNGEQRSTRCDNRSTTVDTVDSIGHRRQADTVANASGRGRDRAAAGRRRRRHAPKERVGADDWLDLHILGVEGDPEKDGSRNDANLRTIRLCFYCRPREDRRALRPHGRRCKRTTLVKILAGVDTANWGRCPKPDARVDRRVWRVANARRTRRCDTSSIERRSRCARTCSAFEDLSGGACAMARRSARPTRWRRRWPNSRRGSSTA